MLLFAACERANKKFLSPEFLIDSFDESLSLDARNQSHKNQLTYGLQYAWKDCLYFRCLSNKEDFSELKTNFHEKNQCLISTSLDAKTKNFTQHGEQIGVNSIFQMKQVQGTKLKISFKALIYKLGQ